MKEIIYKIKIDIPKEDIWKRWIDVENWNEWDGDVLWSKLDGKFSVDETGILKPVKGSKAKFIITEIKDGLSFTTQSSLPLAKIDFIHKIEEKNGEKFLVHSIVFFGPLSFVFYKILGKQFENGLKKAMNNLIKLIKNKK